MDHRYHLMVPFCCQPGLEENPGESTRGFLGFFCQQEVFLGQKPEQGEKKHPQIFKEEKVQGIQTCI